MLQLFFSPDGVIWYRIGFIIDEKMHPIVFCESVDDFPFVFFDASEKIAGYANIKQSAGMVCHDIDEIILFHTSKHDVRSLNFFKSTDPPPPRRMTKKKAILLSLLFDIFSPSSSGYSSVIVRKAWVA